MFLRNQDSERIEIEKKNKRLDALMNLRLQREEQKKEKVADGFKQFKQEMSYNANSKTIQLGEEERQQQIK